jgi:hypothetical protein
MMVVPCHIEVLDVVVSAHHGVVPPHRRRSIPMRFLMMTGESSRPADEALFAEMDAFIQEFTASGQLVATGGLAPDAKKVSSVGDEFTVTDGPFAEAKEAVVGFALIDCDSWDDAIEIARRFRGIAGDGEGTIHQVFGP